MKIGGFDPLDIAKNIGGSMAQDAVRRAAPMGSMFDGNSISTGGIPGLRRNGIGGGGDISELLARMTTKKDKDDQAFDGGGIGNLFKMGTDAVGGIGKALGGLFGQGGPLGMIGGLIKSLLGGLGGLFGGGGGGGLFGGGL